MSEGHPAAFEWAGYFATGFDEVDAQHHKLVDLVNALGERLTSGRPLSVAERDHVLAGLRHYAALHFRTEEEMMAEQGVDPRHLDSHTRAHAEFVAQVEAMLAMAGDTPDAVLPELLRFTSSWLAFHILGADQAMARQLRAMDAGLTAAQAYERDEHPADPGNGALIRAVHTLYRMVAQRNAELVMAKLELEQRVQARTAELEDTLRSLEQARGEIVQVEKMAALGQFAAGMAHELNTPLAYVKGNLNALGGYSTALSHLLQRADAIVRDGPGAEAWRLACVEADRAFIEADLTTLVGESLGGLERIERIVETLRRAAGGVAEPRVRSDLHTLLEDAVARRMESRPPGVELRCDGAAGLYAEVAVQALTEALDEILDNAIQAVAAGGEVVCGGGRDETTVWVEIRDSGAGMLPAIAARVFEPFFTTREVGSGTGLGLYFAYETARLHGGRLTLDSRPVIGTCVRLSLPAA